ncbi:hypothetical protein ABB37_08523 [Leptomonas pyrrhocoris]|uniref:Rab-GAP TBC domain-containing protein n=1 Tax=Leptomonas pyrrhocoris TaxID=157538 RepID=A0A0M9FSQ1_LEPPY|nr:hypothetical protein ABB37_08523 [Leptomonas pyrrhocoris]KPA75207.1 hypothetical protein ABB37_08523 [Leptomonas pyrrhocoris]|eukprot:XP_015653646.1 hypothetical protein ABB37_08523 [Leptomonas pyrrhocoris]
MSSEPAPARASSDAAGDEALAKTVKLHRLQQTEEEYVGYCALLCRTGRVLSGKLRAMVWRDVIIGRKKATPVPLLGDGIIRQFQETRSQSTASAATHTRENTNMEDSFDSTLSRPTPRTADESGGAGGRSAGGEPTKSKDELVRSHEGGDATTSAALQPACSEGGDSDWDVTLRPQQSGAGTSPAASPASPASLHHLHRHRHPSLEPAQPPHAGLLDDVTEDERRGSPKMHTPARRRAVSQLSRRVKFDVNQRRDLWGDGEEDRSGSSSNELPGNVLRPMAWYHLPENCQPRVVEADIERSLWRLHTNPEERAERRRCLRNILLRVLLHNPDRFYYQGLHELVGFVMYTLSPYLDAEEVVSVCEVLFNTRWQKFSARRLTNSEAMLYAIHAVVAQEDPPLAAALEWAGVGPESHYAVSWVITWYVHSVESVTVLTRLFDYFIADPTGRAVIYFTAAFVMSQRRTIFEWIHAAKEEFGVPADAPETTEDGIVLMARVYAQLSRLPGSVLQSMDTAALEDLIGQAEQFSKLYCQMVPEQEEDFLRGDVKKLGMLSNAATRNAALRLLWHFLPREWRNPAKVERVRRFVFWTSVMVAATAIVVGTAAVDVKQGGWVRSLFH